MADYDRFADRYDRTADLSPTRVPIEFYSVFKLLGDITGQDWLDVGCGTGIYTRAMRRRGARRVVGVDLSPEMVRIANEAEANEPLGVEYLVRDAAELEEIAPFDGALGAFLLHYSTDRKHLDRMCRGISRNLAPGGRFVTHQLNPEISTAPGYYRPYGIDFRFPAHALKDGDGFTFRFDSPDADSPEFGIHYWSRPVLDDALAAAGFRDIRWVMPELSPQAAARPDADRWQDYLDRPICVLIEATRS
ncbi:class I SAM-dependent methyltransferase [Kitasatospora sp. NPDC051914]|uniref:class I SAM-dependent methyltransferase n=1 Tax=Kitasatospora sp. NPDC051914 TaxID=3154945 RepID=UPI00343DC790